MTIILINIEAGVPVRVSGLVSMSDEISDSDNVCRDEVHL